ncbi:hypothetical protein Tco_0528756 [Tanacetum coccineum]
MDEGFTASAYPDVHKNLKLTVDEQVIPEEPVSSTGHIVFFTTSLAKEIQLCTPSCTSSQDLPERLIMKEESAPTHGFERKLTTREMLNTERHMKAQQGSILRDEDDDFEDR